MCEMADDKQLPKVIGSMDDFDKLYAHALSYAIRFGCAEDETTSPPNKRRKAK